jgi:Toprim-like
LCGRGWSVIWPTSLTLIFSPLNKNMYDHLKQRGVQDFNGVVVSLNYTIFYIYDILGIVGYQQYNPLGTKDHKDKPKKEDMKYYTFLSDIFQKNYKAAFWGYQHYDKSKNIIFLVEGVFDAYKVINAGYNCLATLGNEPSVLREQLYLLRQYHTIIVIADDDKAGRKLLKYGHKGFICKGGKDLGELSQKEANAFLLNILNSI